MGAASEVKAAGGDLSDDTAEGIGTAAAIDARCDYWRKVRPSLFNRHGKAAWPWIWVGSACPIDKLALLALSLPGSSIHLADNCVVLVMLGERHHVPLAQCDPQAVSQLHAIISTHQATILQALVSSVDLAWGLASTASKSEEVCSAIH